MQPPNTDPHSRGWAPTLTALAIAVFLVVGAETLLPTQAEVQPEGRALPPEDQKRVNEAIDRGVAYLRRTQLANGSWTQGAQGLQDMKTGFPQYWAVGYAALPALTLLECGVKPTDPALQKAARFVRQHIKAQKRTYEISLAILFLDRLGESEDRALIRSLALRLAAGQNITGGWAYLCPLLARGQEEKLLKYLRDRGQGDSRKPPAKAGKPPASVKEAVARLRALGKKGRFHPPLEGDNSNTQFAILALWAARRYDLPLEYTVARVEERFRASQEADGWAYEISSSRRYGSMACAGLLGLALGRGWGDEAQADAKGPARKAEDKGIADGLRTLGALLDDPTGKDPRGKRDDRGVKKGAVNLYYLWSVERVGVFCGLKTIGGKDWYKWGVKHLLPAQKEDGSWFTQGYLGSTPTIDTCFALLFLKRADLLPGLRERLQQRLAITDPGPSSPGEKKEKSPKEALGDPAK
jgi:hypothetical protein